MTLLLSYHSASLEVYVYCYMLLQSGPGGDNCSQISAKFLVKFVERVFTNEWVFMQIGIYLDFMLHEIEFLKTNSRNNIRMAGFSLMNQWMNRTAGSADRKCCILAKVLLDAGLGHVAQELGLPVTKAGSSSASQTYVLCE